jgi:hypothetical protein
MDEDDFFVDLESYVNERDSYGEYDLAYDDDEGYERDVNA